ncbi:MAG: hypothetical protein RLZZ370_1554 [Bacteroidota bacterium]|jgi:hypothetical protein
MTPILRLHYQYRDDADRVSSGSFDFSNPEKLGVKQAMSMLEPLLIGEVFFIPNRIGLPSLDVLPFGFAQGKLAQDDRAEDEDDDYHELESLEALETETAEAPSFVDFVAALRRFKQQHPEEYW